MQPVVLLLRGCWWRRLPSAAVDSSGSSAGGVRAAQSRFRLILLCRPRPAIVPFGGAHSCSRKEAVHAAPQSDPASSHTRNSSRCGSWDAPRRTTDRLMELHGGFKRRDSENRIGGGRGEETLAGRAQPLPGWQRRFTQRRRGSCMERHANDSALQQGPDWQACILRTVVCGAVSGRLGSMHPWQGLECARPQQPRPWMHEMSLSRLPLQVPAAPRLRSWRKLVLLGGGQFVAFVCIRANSRRVKASEQEASSGRSAARGISMGAGGSPEGRAQPTSVGSGSAPGGRHA